MRSRTQRLMQQIQSPPLHKWILVLFLLTMFALYIHQLDGASLWRDEALTIVRAEQPFWQIFANRNIVQGKVSPDLHPPLYFLILHLWQRAVGHSEFAYRVPSVFFMLLALAALYQVGRKVWGGTTAVFTLLLAMFSPFLYWYAREARMYALLFLEVLIFLRLLWPMLTATHHRPGEIALLGLGGLLLISTQYTGIFIVFSALILLFFTLVGKRMRWQWLIAGAFVLLAGGFLLAPHLIELLSLPEFFAFSQRQLWVLVSEGINTFSLGSAGPLGTASWQILPFALLGLVGMISLDTDEQNQRRQKLLFGAGLLLLTLLAFFAASWLKANYSNPRHLTVLAALWFLLMGHGLATLWRYQKLAVVGLGSLVVFLSGQALWQTIAQPPFVKDDVRALATYIEARQQPGDLVLWHDAVMMVTYDYYSSDLPFTAVPEFGTNDPTAAVDQLEKLDEQYNRIWFVSAPSPAYFNPQVVPSWLKAHRLQSESTIFPASWAYLQLNLLNRADTIQELPPNSLPVGLDQGNYHLEAVALEERVREEGVWVSLYWQTAVPSPDPPSACLRLQDSGGTVWSEGCATLSLPEGDTATVDGYYRQQVWLPLTRGMPPIDYQILARLGEAFVNIGSTPLAAWPVVAPPNNIATYSDAGLQLVALNWHADDFRAGLWALGDLLWYTEKPLTNNLALNLRVVDFWGRPLLEQTTPLGSPDYPAGQWAANSYAQTPIVLPLPFSLVGSYRLQVELVTEDGQIIAADELIGRDWVTAGRINIGSWPIVTTLPETATALQDVIFGEAISLVGYEVQRGKNDVTVALFWESSAPIAEDYGVFVHIAEPNSPPITQSSRAPANWLRPTTTWRVGEIVADEHTIELPALEAEANLVVSVGIFSLADANQRLPLTVVGTAVPSGSYILQELPDVDSAP